jgi:hypothetical protein
MQELHYLIAGQFLVATLMGLGALCLFVWAAAAGLLRDVEPVKYQVLEVEGVAVDTEGVAVDTEGVEPDAGEVVHDR